MFDKEYQLYGKHAEMMFALASDSSGNQRAPESFFGRFLDVFLVAPLVGFLYQRKSPVDSSSTASPRSIFAEQIISERDRLMLNYRLITLLDEKKTVDINTRIGKAFREADQELVAQNLETYYAYVRGGIELLYEKLIGTTKNEEERIGNMMDFIDEFSELFKLMDQSANE